MIKDDKKAVLEMLEMIPNITAVSRLLGLGPHTVYRERKRDPKFDDAVKEAIEIGYDTIEEEARRRAVDGVLEPVFFQGVQVGEVRKYSDSLLKFLLRGYRKKFNPNAQLKISDDKKVLLKMEISGDGD